MNEDYQHLQAQNKASLQANQQNLQELHAENAYLRQLIVQLNNHLIVQRQQWSEEHFKLQEKIEELQNYAEGLLKEIYDRQDSIEKLQRMNWEKTQEVVTIRLLYNSVLQQLISNEGKKESKVTKMKITSIEEFNDCSIRGSTSKIDPYVTAKQGSQEEIQTHQLGVVQTQVSIQNNLHKLTAQFDSQSIIINETLPICSKIPICSLLQELKQIKTNQTIPKNMVNNQNNSSNTSFYFQYSNNSSHNRSLNSAPESHLPHSHQSTYFEPKQQAIPEQTQEESCNWEQMMSFFLGGMWSGACLTWVFAN